MNFREFEEIMQGYLKEIGTKLDTSEQEAFYNYMNLLLKWNENIKMCIRDSINSNQENLMLARKKLLR